MEPSVQISSVIRRCKSRKTHLVQMELIPLNTRCVTLGHVHRHVLSSWSAQLQTSGTVVGNDFVVSLHTEVSNFRQQAVFVRWRLLSQQIVCDEQPSFFLSFVCALGLHWDCRPCSLLQRSVVGLACVHKHGGPSKHARLFHAHARELKYVGGDRLKISD